MREAVRAIRAIADARRDVRFLFPVHPNPNVRAIVDESLAGHPRVRLTAPLGYLEFVAAMRDAHLILTDSGGVQEEAPSLGKPVLVMRKTTERPEGVKAGTCRLVGTDPADILSEVQLLFSDTGEYERRSRIANPYGDGQAADRIVRILERNTL